MSGPAEDTVTVFAGLAELEQALGTHLGCSAWHTITQRQIDTFAEATGDHQWIHVDPEQAADGPFGTTIAHGYLTLSLVPMLMLQVYRIEGMRMSVNYGVNKVRFPEPVPVGSRVRAGVMPLSLTEGGGGHQLVARVTIEREGAVKPACVVETVSVLVPR
ncbi:MaoC family dehydratase [Sciscionella marina]|uniref:MaoC family dehydratase n=1 Tax=Sciscionella marina TaxID=508770 RepID=UPI000381A5D3|nr:MaoC family dehydratase [Sciscionella marina]